MFTFLLVVHAIIAAALVGVILMQRSEGGGLGMGGSPTGLMSARGAADFLTRATTILATLFVLMSITLAVIASIQRGPRQIDTSLARTPGAAAGLAPAAPANGVPLVDPLAGPAPVNAAAPLAVPSLPGVAPAPAAAGNSATTAATATARRQRAAERTATGPAGNEAAPAKSASTPAETSQPRAAAPAPPADSSPGTTNANSAVPLAQ